MQPDGVRLLLAALQLVGVVELFGEQPQGEPASFDLDRPGKLLPEFREGEGQGHLLTEQGDDRIGTQTEGFLASLPYSIPPEGAGDMALAVDVIAALPVVAAAGVLVKFKTRSGAGWAGCCGSAAQRMRAASGMIPLNSRDWNLAAPRPPRSHSPPLWEARRLLCTVKQSRTKPGDPKKDSLAM